MSKLSIQRVFALVGGPVGAFLFLLPWLLGASECNSFSNAANTTSDAALTFKAQQQIDSQDYTDAATTISQISAATLATHDGLTLQASAQAGLCGLNLVNMANDVKAQFGTGVTATTTIIAMMLGEMKTATSYANCSNAQGFLQAIPSAQLTADDEIFLAFVELAKIGAVLESVPNSVVDPTHSGTVASGLNPCLAANIPDQYVGEVGASLNIAVQALNASGLTIASGVTSQLTSICSPAGVINCSVYTWQGFSANDLLALRSAINTNEVGLNTCPGPITQTSCLCLHN